MRSYLASLDTVDRFILGGIALQAIGFALLPLSLSALGLIVPGLWAVGFGILLGRRST